MMEKLFNKRFGRITIFVKLKHLNNPIKIALKESLAEKLLSLEDPISAIIDDLDAYDYDWNMTYLSESQARKLDRYVGQTYIQQVYTF